MKTDNLIIAVGGNITNKQGVHPTKVCDDAINPVSYTHLTLPTNREV